MKVKRIMIYSATGKGSWFEQKVASECRDAQGFIHQDSLDFMIKQWKYMSGIPYCVALVKKEAA